MDTMRDKLASALRIEDAKFLRELLAECLGTFFLLLIGNSANIQSVVATGGNSTSCHIAWGIGFMFAVYLAASVSGAHLNPAISVAQSILGNLPSWKIIPFAIMQVIGAFLGAALSYFGHHDDLWKLDGGLRQVSGSQATAGLFTTFPSDHMSTWGSLLDQIIGTAMLSGLVCLITDKRHKIPAGLVPPLAGGIMSMVAMTYGANGGFAINPARDFGPRLFCLCAGYGWEVFRHRNYYFWIPIVGPLIGAIIGAWIYKLFIGLHGLNEKLEIDPVNKMFHDVFRSSDGVLIGYDNTLSRTNGAQTKHYEPSYQIWKMGFLEAKYWLPRGTQWEDLHGQHGTSSEVFPHPTHLAWALVLGITLTGLRVIFDNFIFVPLAFFLQKTAAETRVELMEREKKFRRMSECMFRCMYYALAFLYGICVISQQEYAYDLKECWRNWPLHPVPQTLAWYYMTQGGFYISLIISMTWLDAARSDHYQMLAHHFITLSLITISWSMNMVRVGSLVLLSHDAVDILIDLAKIFRYAGNEKALMYTFICVLVVWVLTRLVYYPFWVLNSVWFDAPSLIQADYSWLNVTELPVVPRIIMVLLSLLLVLHIFWTYILFKVAYESAHDGVLDDRLKAEKVPIFFLELSVTLTTALKFTLLSRYATLSFNEDMILLLLFLMALTVSAENQQHPVYRMTNESEIKAEIAKLLIHEFVTSMEMTEGQKYMAEKFLSTLTM
ncbi:unnamed protein product [Caenorhabditis auriculariae]|uniref:TLC domain-containing protein n=1 Tax=Caenorhabditis auriculariae TaxID=2777116 RepID=A0A8S1GWH5_9PELO|nr:unnamed protein product [Caenorhabditis auriculariae]